MARPRGPKTKAITVHGIEELRRKFKKLDEQTRARIKRATEKSTENVFAKIVARFPRRSGVTAKGIRRRVNKAGTRGRVTHPKKMFWIRFNEFGTKRQPARPVFFPALEEERQAHMARLRDALRGGMESIRE